MRLGCANSSFRRVGAAEHLLADIGNRATLSRRRAGQALHRTGGKTALVADDHRHDGAARSLLFVRDQVGNFRHRHDRDFPAQAFREPLLRGAGLQLRNELVFDGLDMLQAIDAHE